MPQDSYMQTTTDIKNSYRMMTAYDANGNMFNIDLDLRNRTTCYVLEMNTYKGEAKAANIVATKTWTALSIESARNFWAEALKEAKAAFSITAYEGFTVAMDKTVTENKWEAAPAGPVRSAGVSYHDGNEGSYFASIDVAGLMMVWGGTACPDIPHEITSETFTSVAQLEKAFTTRVAKMDKSYYREAGYGVVYANCVHAVVDSMPALA